MALVVVSALLVTVGVDGPLPARADTAAAAGEFVPLTPSRVVDTRSGLGGRSTPLTSGVTASFQVTGVGGVPTSGVSAVSITVTAVAPTATSFLTVWAQGDARPATSQLSLNSGITVANTLISKVSATGQISVFNNAGSTDVLVDVVGYYTNNTTTTAGGTFVPLTPQRIYDTRNGLGGSSTPLGSGETRLVPVLGQGGVPASGVSAVVVNVTGTASTQNTFLDVWGSGPYPATSTVNLQAGQDAGAMVQSALTSAGQLSVFNHNGTADVVVDVEGYYLTPAQDAQNYFVPVTPTRVYSTTQGINAKAVPMTSGSTASVPIRGVKSGATQVVPNSKSVSAVVLSVTAVNPGRNGNMGVFPEGVTRPPSTILNYTAGATTNVTGSVVAKVGADGRVSVYAHGGTPGLIVDVQGYFQSSPPPAPPAPTIASSSFPAGGWAASGTQGTVSVSVTGVSGPAVRQYRWALDDPSMAAPAVVTVPTDNAAGSFSLKPADGWHTLYVQAVNTANNVSPVTGYTFGTGVAITAPAQGTRVTRYVRLSGRASGSFGSVTWKYRRASSDGWAPLPAGDVTNNGTGIGSWPVSGTSGSSGLTTPTLVWDAGTSLGADGTTQLQACYTPTAGGAAQCTQDGVDPTVTVDSLDVGNTDASVDLGGGALDLLTGNLAISTTDASVSAPASDLTISRTWNTLAPTRSSDPATGQPSIFGPGWSTALSVDSAGSTWTGLSDRGSTVAVVDGDGATTVFAKGADGKYAATGDDAGSGLTLTAGTGGTNGPSSWTVGDLDGNATTFAPSGSFSAAASPAAPHAYQVSSVSQPGSNQVTTYSYDASGRPTRMLAPTPAGSTCATWVPGCRALDLSYDGSGHLSSITYRSVDSAGAPLGVVVACYTYDGTGHLSSTWDPRDASSGGAGVDCTTPVRATGYTYDGTGRLSAITPPGLAATTLSYDGTGRVTSVTRTHDAAHGGSTETTAVVYGVPTTADGSHPEYRPDLSGTTIAAWGQAEAPVTGTAVFGPGHTSSSVDLRGATVSYLNAEGRTVNDADYAGTGADGWNIDTSDYDAHGNVVRTLTAANLAEALHPDTADPDLKLPTDTAAAAAALSTTNIYAYDAAGVGDLVDTFGPYHLTTVTGYAAPVGARAHTHTTFDNGSELGHPAGGVLHLVTASTTGASLSPMPVATDETDQRTTTIAYALSSTDATGWTFRAPMRVTTDPAGLNISTITRYDPTIGAVVETRQPKSTGTDAATRATVYYSAGTNDADPACGNKPAWADLVCTVGPKAQPGVAGMPGLVSTRVDTYDYLGRATQVSETVTDASGATKTRTTTTTFTNGGYGTDTATTAITGGLGAAVPATSATYDPATGLVTKVSASATDTQAATTSSTGYDDFGRVTSYTDNDQATGAQANTTTTSYDSAGRVATVTDAKGSTTYTYNQAGETRDEPTTMTVSGVGDFTATYDADGALATQTLPNGQVQQVSTDETGSTTGRTDIANGRTWIAETVSSNAHGQIVAHDYLGAADYGGHHHYSYDAAGRLTTTQDTLAANNACTTRTYSFDADSNRTSNASYNPAADGTCQSTTPASSATHTFDIADRLQASGADAGLGYDAFGRITTLPNADTSNAGGDVTVGYYANDLVRSQTQAAATMTWTLDAAGRFAAWTTRDGAMRTNHYDDGSSDSPGWVAETSDASTWTRNIQGLDGNLAVTVTQAGVITWQVSNLHGDIAATASSSATEPASYYLVDEFGLAEGAAPPRYGALGAKQRSTESLAGITLMGARLYNPVSGAFTSVDPIYGGNTTAYAYPQDPVDMTDLTGQFGCSFCRAVWNAAKRIAARSQAVAVGIVVMNYSRVTWGKCGMIHGIAACRGGFGHAYSRGGTTLGFVYVTSGDPRYVRRARIAHERVHVSQWMHYGGLMIPLYLKAGSNPCRNRFEVEAGLKRGGYTCS